MTLLSAATLLVLVLDPFGNIPLFFAALRQVAARRRWWVALERLSGMLLTVVAVQMLLDGIVAFWR